LVRGCCPSDCILLLAPVLWVLCPCNFCCFCWTLLLRAEFSWTSCCFIFSFFSSVYDPGAAFFVVVCCFGLYWSFSGVFCFRCTFFSGSSSFHFTCFFAFGVSAMFLFSSGASSIATSSFRSCCWTESGGYVGGLGANCSSRALGLCAKTAGGSIGAAFTGALDLEALSQVPRVSRVSTLALY
jgi:hypothetical protein